MIFAGYKNMQIHLHTAHACMADMWPPGLPYPFAPPPPRWPFSPPPPPPWRPPPSTPPSRGHDISSSSSSGGIVAGVLISLVAALLALAIMCALCQGHRNSSRASAAAAAAAAAAAQSRPPPQMRSGGDGGDDGGGGERQLGRSSASPSAPPWPTALVPAFTYSRSVRRNVGGDDGEEEETAAAAAACSVCLGAFQLGETVRLLPACLHLYHAECIDPWLDAHTTCPLCRSDTGDPSPVDAGRIPPV